jgi:hypothetical protein
MVRICAARRLVVSYMSLVLAQTAACYDRNERGEASPDGGAALEPSCASTAGAERTSYLPCARVEECPGLNAFCAGYTASPQQAFCADYCEQDSSCPVVSGFESVCNFAWCALLCDDGQCPSGMTCLEQQHLIDGSGDSKGSHGICVISL